MASMLQKLLKNQRTTTRMLANFTKPILIPPFLHQIRKPESPDHLKIKSFPFLETPTSENPNPNHHSLQFYPSFSFGFFLDPVSPPGLLLSESKDVGEDDVMWADSVKKKRKKKMNKHKLKKLRKRLRKKT